MYIVNDINYLITLLKLCKVQELLPADSISVSRLKMHQHDGIIRQQLKTYTKVGYRNIDDIEQFETWRKSTSQYLSEGDLSTLYIAFKMPDLTVLLADDDLILPMECEKFKIRYRQWDDLIQEIADEKLIKMYELIKAS